ncbi:MAG: TrbC/VirB2 family protein [Candidatus Pacebacteria bacterium]|nr:TrbC/VirB2 family protein [Candidatus Paceibacterota bacterium]
MKRLFKTLSLMTLLILFPLTISALAIDNPISSNTFGQFIVRLINLVRTISLLVAPIMIIIAGYFFVTSMGNPEKIQTAQRLILWTVIGMIIVLSASALVTLITTIF